MAASMPAVSGMIRTMAASPRVHLANPKKNAEEIAALLDIADANGVQLCVFPELCLTGYTCGDLFLQPALLNAALDALKFLMDKRASTAFVVGLPLEIDGQLYNCAAVVSGGRLGLVPKEYLPNHAEFYEARWFAPGHAAPQSVSLFGQTAPIGQQLVFDCGSFAFGVEICEDLWVPEQPSARLAKAGALLIANPSASNELTDKHLYRQQLLCQQSARCLCGYLYAGAGYGESTTDAVYSGYAGVYENGAVIAENERFSRESTYVLADVDCDVLRYKRRQSQSFFAGAASIDRMHLTVPASPQDGRLLKPLSPLPFVPQGAHREAQLEEALMIMTQGLLFRMEHVHTRRAVLGVSGGLDSTLTLLALAYAYDRAGWDRKGIVGITMPGLGTGSRTKGNASRLMELIGCTCLEIPIGSAVAQHFTDIGQSPDVHDVCYENSQARERTQIVMDYANKVGGLALGTGDLSELALGWCTYNGDQMSMYNMSGSIPKTLIRDLVDWLGRHYGGEVLAVARDILDTPISPELIPGKEGELTQRTEDTLGAYALHDFFLWHMMHSGASPKKLYALACYAFDGEYDHPAILHALTTFVRRFFTQQFKRSAMPDGPKVTPVGLSPRGDWRMPSDAQMQLWMDEIGTITP
ncbi:MAG: NAD(+) synthase [Candidatus Ventricola sp.]